MTERTTKDALFARYRAELTLRPEARARTLRRLQERLARGEKPRPESDVPPPSAATVHGLAGAQLGLVAAAACGLVVGVVLWMQTPGSEQHRPAAPVVQRTQAAPEAPPLLAAPEARPLSAASEDSPLAAAEAEVSLPKAASESAVRSGGPSQTSRSAATTSRSSPLRATSRALRSAPAPSAAPQPEAASAARPHENQAPLSAAVERLSAAPGTAAKGDAAPATDTLTRELQLVQDAQLALRDGHTQRALALLAEHTWTFPHGALAETRDVARIVALCQAGHVAQSKQYAKRFLQQRPSSPFAQRVRAGCDP